jgi:class 3 adenylate cyclase
MMALSNTQLPQQFRKVVEAEVDHFGEPRTIQNRNGIPETSDIPLDPPNHWLKIPNVICVFVDMRGSTKLSASTHEKTTAGAYRLFTGTAVKLFHELEAAYIDIKGDGVFALFDAGQEHRALAAAVTVKTFVVEEFSPRIKEKTDQDVGGRYGIDQKTVLVRRLGLRRHGGRTDRQNEVWAGKPVNMAAKLSTLDPAGHLHVSERFYERLTAPEALRSCGCPNGETIDLWSPVDVEDDTRFDFKRGYSLASQWCKTHGDAFCSRLLRANGT